MNIAIKAMKYQLSPETEAIVEEKLAAPLRLLGDKAENALLEIELAEAPPEGRSSEPVHLIARLAIEGNHEVFKAEATKPTPEIAADRVRAELESEIRKSRGRTRTLFRRGASRIKEMLRFGS